MRKFVLLPLLVLSALSCKKQEEAAPVAPPASPTITSAAKSAAPAAAPDNVALWVRVSNIRAAWKGFAHYAHADDKTPEDAFSQLFSGEAGKRVKLDGPMAVALPLAGLSAPSPVIAVDVGNFNDAKAALKPTSDAKGLHVQGAISPTVGPGVGCDLVDDNGNGSLVCGKAGDIESAGAFAGKSLLGMKTDGVITIEVLPQHARALLKMAPGFAAQNLKDPAQLEQLSRLVDMLLDTRVMRLSLSPQSEALSAKLRMDFDNEASVLTQSAKKRALSAGNIPADFDAVPANAIAAQGAVGEVDLAADIEQTKASLKQLGLPAELGDILASAAQGPGKPIAQTLRANTVGGEPVFVATYELDMPRDIKADTDNAKKAATALKGQSFKTTVIPAWAGSKLPADSLRVSVKLKPNPKTPASLTIANVYEGKRLTTIIATSNKAVDDAFASLATATPKRIGELPFVVAGRKDNAKQMGMIRIDSVMKLAVEAQKSWSNGVKSLNEQQAKDVPPMTFVAYSAGTSESAKLFSVWGDLNVPAATIDAVVAAATGRP